MGYINLIPRPQTLNGSLTLELVNEKYWKLRKPLELFYAPTMEQPPSEGGPRPHEGLQSGSGASRELRPC